ncbi:hypothetical protein Nepgr_030600 [Nepenthes gracilis]|uniref:DUF7811 domain-containing protein n=1 Tax=Nepenthes gracilis TaxID=150966 RepID=A0AAD3THA5_NEPGR|nr:hypothetical protein Nepgr_030600 [Nepenthes gracilis]
MAEASSMRFASISSVPKPPRSIDISPSLSSLSLYPFHCHSSRFIRIRAKASNSGNFSGNDDDPYGFYPWEAANADNSIQWVPEDKVTLFTADGLIQIGGSLVPRRITSVEKRQEKSKTSQRYQRFQEKDYMDPSQSLCIGALFDIAATNGQDMGRRLCIIGFCRSIEMLSDVVEDTVLEHGGEVVAAAKATDGGLHEKLTMKVAVPLLWGVPPASETLHLAVRTGGGIVEKVYWQWHFL